MDKSSSAATYSRSSAKNTFSLNVERLSDQIQQVETFASKQQDAVEEYNNVVQHAVQQSE